MKISIIVPNYNHQDFLPKRLDTIFNQTFQDFEVILLDDCSTDGSWEYLKQFENHPKVSHCIRNESNSGSPFKQWKKGLELAKYDWIWIAESDDFSDRNFLSESSRKVDEYTNVIFCKSIYVDGNNSQISEANFITEMKEFEIQNSFEMMHGVEFIRNYLSLRNFIINASSALFKKPNEFPIEIQEMKFIGDWYFWIFLLKNGNVKYISRPFNYFRFHSYSTRSWKSVELEFLKLHEKMKCISYSFSFFSLIQYLQINIENYSILIIDYFSCTFKLGRGRMISIFPKIPIAFYSKYYRLYFLSVFRK